MVHFCHWSDTLNISACFSYIWLVFDLYKFVWSVRIEHKYLLIMVPFKELNRGSFSTWKAEELGKCLQQFGGLDGNCLFPDMKIHFLSILCNEKIKKKHLGMIVLACDTNAVIFWRCHGIVKKLSLNEPGHWLDLNYQLFNERRGGD